MKKLITAMLLLCLTMGLMVPTSALEYTINAPGDPDYGKATSIEPVITAGGGTMKNEDVSKNAALFPPAFGSPSADTLGTGSYLTPNLAPATMVGAGEIIEGNSAAIVPPVLVLVFSLLPVWHISLGRRWNLAGVLLGALIWTEVILTNTVAFSPFWAIYELVQQQMSWKTLLTKAETSVDVADKFYCKQVSNYIQRPADLPDAPNVILVFIEGFSQNIIEDSRNIVPNLRLLQENSIHFTNYYNHTFATYMALSGQLYSGYQHSHYDVNNLISIQDIFSAYGYQTTFINVEPRNNTFSAYLTDLRFDELLTNTDVLDGIDGTNSDKTAFEILFETAKARHAEGKKFFLSMYSLGTHVSFDGIYEQYGDGSDPLLNKFRDMDTQIGEFLRKFSESDLAEDTVLIFTADHATYQDADFINTFPDYRRAATMLDRIPLIIWYQGVKPQEYDVKGRNSLDMAPTVLDFLDMSAPNYFLGDSLFAEESISECDMIFESFGAYRTTENGEIRYLLPEESDVFEKYLVQYYAAKAANEAILDTFQNSPNIAAETNAEGTVIKTELHDAEQWDTFRYGVWSAEDGQDDIQWFTVEGNHQKRLLYSIDLGSFYADGLYIIHVYAEDGDQLTYVAGTAVTVDMPEVRIYEKNEDVLSIYAEVNADSTAIESELYQAEQWDAFRYGVWSAEDGQDDIQWFTVEGNHQKKLTYSIDLGNFYADGLYIIHVYAEDGDQLTYVAGTEVTVDMPDGAISRQQEND